LDSKSYTIMTAAVDGEVLRDGKMSVGQTAVVGDGKKFEMYERSNCIQEYKK